MNTRVRCTNEYNRTIERTNDRSIDCAHPQDKGVTAGDALFLCYRQDMPLRDIVVFDASRSNRPSGYETVNVDANLRAGEEDDAAEIYFAFSRSAEAKRRAVANRATSSIGSAGNTGGADLIRVRSGLVTRDPSAPVTGLRLVGPRRARQLLSSTGSNVRDITPDANTASTTSSTTTSSTSMNNVLAAQLRGRRLLVEYGEGCPVSNITVYRAPKVPPQYGIGSQNIISLAPFSSPSLAGGGSRVAPRARLDAREAEREERGGGGGGGEGEERREERGVSLLPSICGRWLCEDQSSKVEARRRRRELRIDLAPGITRRNARLVSSPSPTGSLLPGEGKKRKEEEGGEGEKSRTAAAATTTTTTTAAATGDGKGMRLLLVKGVVLQGGTVVGEIDAVAFQDDDTDAAWRSRDARLRYQSSYAAAANSSGNAAASSSSSPASVAGHELWGTVRLMQRKGVASLPPAAANAAKEGCKGGMYLSTEFSRKVDLKSYSRPRSFLMRIDPSGATQNLVEAHGPDGEWSDDSHLLAAKEAGKGASAASKVPQCRGPIVSVSLVRAKSVVKARERAEMEGYELLSRTVSGALLADLNAGAGAKDEIYIATKRGPMALWKHYCDGSDDVGDKAELLVSSHPAPITEIGLHWPNLEQLGDDWSPAPVLGGDGSPNLNEGCRDAGTTILLVFKRAKRRKRGGSSSGSGNGTTPRLLADVCVRRVDKEKAPSGDGWREINDVAGTMRGSGVGNGSTNAHCAGYDTRISARCSSDPGSLIDHYINGAYSLVAPIAGTVGVVELEDSLDREARAIAADRGGGNKNNAGNGGVPGVASSPKALLGSALLSGCELQLAVVGVTYGHRVVGQFGLSRRALRGHEKQQPASLLLPSPR